MLADEPRRISYPDISFQEEKKRISASQDARRRERLAKRPVMTRTARRHARKLARSVKKAVKSVRNPARRV
jgi:multidrug resistance efflux pump